MIKLKVGTYFIFKSTGNIYKVIKIHMSPREGQEYFRSINEMYQADIKLVWRREKPNPQNHLHRVRHTYKKFDVCIWDIEVIPKLRALLYVKV